MPQPPFGQIRAAAKATAADERPEPGGPVKIQAWVIPCLEVSGDSALVRDAATAPCKISVMWDWPTKESKTDDDIYRLKIFFAGLSVLFNAGSSATRAMIAA